jgi:hypothetical protein
MTPAEFTVKCFPRGSGDVDYQWVFEYPHDRLLPLISIMNEDDLMRNPDMRDSNGEPCMLVVKNGNTTGTTLGRANGVYSIVREYFRLDMTVHRTYLEWGIINYDSKSGGFSEPGDSGAIIADIRGRVGGMITGGAGMSETKCSDMTYATPFWWLLERIRANGFPNVHLA